MTSIFNINSSSSSNLAVESLGDSSTLSNAKYPTTFIIQPPSSDDSPTLLSKRFKSTQLGGLLLKKVKSQTTNSSHNNSPTLKDVTCDSPYCKSNIDEEVDSPTVSSFDIVQSLSLTQKSISAPIFSSTLKLSKPSNYSAHKQLINALDTLQKRITEYHITNLRDTIIKTHFAQMPLAIPPLYSSETQAATPVRKTEVEKKIISLDDEDDIAIYYGDVEYPLLHLAPKSMQVEEVKKVPKTTNKVKNCNGKKAAKTSNCSSPSEDNGKEYNSLLESLLPTREGTQRSEPEIATNLKEFSEKVIESLEKKTKRSKKDAKKEKALESEEKVGKSQKKQKVKELNIEKVQEKEKKGKSKVEQKELLLTPVSKARRVTERKRNRWQLQEENKAVSPQSEKIEEESDDDTQIRVGVEYQVKLPEVGTKGEKGKKRVLKIKWDPSSQAADEMQNFFEKLRNLLNYNVEEDKAIILFQENGSSVKKTLNVIKANKDKYLKRLVPVNSN